MGDHTDHTEKSTPHELPLYQKVEVPSQTSETARQYMAQMVDSLDAILELDLASFAANKTLPAKLFELLSEALDCYDHYIEHIVTAEGWDVSCRRGCSACCEHELARGVTALEALNIYRHVRDWEDIGSLYEHAAENAVTFQQLLAEEMRREPGPLGPDDPRVTKAHLAYNRLKRPCPFLDREQGACRIYPVRPLVCRFFFNLSPAEWCDPDHEGYLKRETRCMDPYTAVQERLHAINQRLGIRVLHFLSGAFMTLAGNVMEGKPLQLV